MDFAYLDESGDLGGKGSKYLVLCLFITNKNKEISQIMKWCKQQILQSKKGQRWFNRNGGTIKHYGFPDKDLLKQLTNKLAKINGYVYSLALDKNKVTVGKDSKQFVLGRLFQHIMQNKGTVPVCIVADTDYFNDSKVNYFALTEYEEKEVEIKISISKVTYAEYLKLLEEGKKCVKINHEKININFGLQAIDIIAGVLFRKNEHDDSELYNILKSSTLKIIGTTLRKK